MKALFLLFGLLLIGADLVAQEIPFHPCRKIGDKSYDLSPLYSWMKERKENSGTGNPMPDWVGWYVENSPGVVCQFEVMSVKTNGLLIHKSTATLHSKGYYAPVFLANFPGYQSLTNNQKIQFLAKQTGTFPYSDNHWGSIDIPYLDYGVVCNVEK